MSVFRFREFNITQSENPLKVGTDSMLLGSLIDSSKATHALDIGAGTGVLSLMVLQANPIVLIDAVEIHPEAAKECALNFQNSPWADRTRVHEVDFLSFQGQGKYDLIFSNPPFYLDGLKSGNPSIDQAKHIRPEVFRRWMEKTRELLTENGLFYVIMPFAHWDFLQQITYECQLHLMQQITIHATAEKLNSRIIAVFSKEKKDLLASAFTIREINGKYTKEYITLTAAFHHTDLSAKN